VRIAEPIAHDSLAEAASGAGLGLAFFLLRMTLSEEPVAIPHHRAGQAFAGS